MKKRLIFIILLIFISLSLSSCSIIRKVISSGDYNYRIFKKNRKKVAEIVGLSDIGMEKEVIVIPRYIDGYRVFRIKKPLTIKGGIFGGNNDNHKIYITYKFDEFNFLCFQGQQVLYLGEGLLNTESYGYIYYHAFVPFNVDLSKDNVKGGHVRYANVTYMVDDEIYWIDECENGPIEYIPEEPKKDGLSFEGWYKDKDFINKWDFEKDWLAPIEKIEHNVLDEINSESWTEYKYEEVMLYAKFN